MVPRAEARESQAHRAQYRTSLGGALLTFHVSVHLTNGLPRFGSQVLGVRVKPALCGGLRRAKQPARPTASPTLQGQDSAIVLVNWLTHVQQPSITKARHAPTYHKIIIKKNIQSEAYKTDPKLNPLARALGVQRNGCDFETLLFHCGIAAAARSQLIQVETEATNDAR